MSSKKNPQDPWSAIYGLPLFVFVVQVCACVEGWMVENEGFVTYLCITNTLTRALHGVGNPWGPRFTTGNGWKWVNFQGNLRGGAVTRGQ